MSAEPVEHGFERESETVVNDNNGMEMAGPALVSHRPNELLRAARLARLSPSGSGRRLSRQELAEAVNAWVFGEHGKVTSLTYSYIGKLERGEHRWPSAPVRSGLRASLNAATDAEIGLFIIRNDGLPVDAPLAGVVGGAGAGSAPQSATLTPHASMRHFLGSELRRWREGRGMSTYQLAQRLHVSRDLVQKVEKAQRMAQTTLVASCDDVLGTGGALARLLALIRHTEQLPEREPEPQPVPIEVVIRVVAEAVSPGGRPGRQAAGGGDARIYPFRLRGQAEPHEGPV